MMNIKQHISNIYIYIYNDNAITSIDKKKNNSNPSGGRVLN
jgi:hypothetical protein